jgi:phosphodiesterase/alkaline phosphatase D-like protein
MSNLNDFIRRQFSRRGLFAGFFGATIAIASDAQANAVSATVTYAIAKGTQPTSAQITVKASQSARVYVEYGYSSGKYSAKTAIVTLPSAAAKTITLSNLKVGSKIFFRVRYAFGTAKTYLAKPQAFFQTPSNFEKSVFAVQADPHMDENSDANVYNGTLAQIVKAAPAFLVDLGDIFMVDKLPDKSEKNIRARYELMKGYYQKLGNIPLKIVLGNHDGELGYSNFNTKKFRAEYFPEQTSELSYFSFEGPDQLHICLDPFTYTTTNPKADGWQWTLGKTQYDWLKSTLEKSSALHKFVYIHHLLVGDAQSRGGSEIAKFNEWGGANMDGTPGFAKNRSGWYKPVHQLLVEHKVGFVFKGHDHIYVKQELDGIIYQTLPQPSHPGDKADSSQYGYQGGKTVGGSGFLKVTTTGSTAKVDFVKFDGTIADSYERTA